MYNPQYLYIDITDLHKNISKELLDNKELYWWIFDNHNRVWKKGDKITLYDLEDYIEDWMDSMELGMYNFKDLDFDDSFTSDELIKAEWLLKTLKQLEYEDVKRKH